MADHWWWRPGVRPGRGVLVWHILLEDQPAVHALARECQERLANVGGLDLVPIEWLHLTTQVVGFPDEIAGAEVDAMVAAAAESLRAMEPVPVELGEVLDHREAVVLGVRPPRALHPVRDAIREAIARTVTRHRLDESSEWTPHMSVAYSNSDGPAAPVYGALAERPAPRSLTVRNVRLVLQQRQGHLYRWDEIASVPLGRGGHHDLDVRG